MTRSLGGPSRLLRSVQPRPITRVSPTSRGTPSQLPAILFRHYASTSTATAIPPQSITSNPTTPTPSPASSRSRPDQNDRNDGESDPDPESGPEPKGAYAKFKALTKKYGWYALGMYTLLSSIDFSLSFLLVHTLGVERIEPLWTSLLHTYRSVRYDSATADSMAKDDRQKKEEEKKVEQEEREKNGGRGREKGYWGSRAFWAEAVLAYGIHKTALLPFRAGLTVAWTPKVVGWLTRRGWIGKVSRRLDLIQFGWTKRAKRRGGREGGKESQTWREDGLIMCGGCADDLGRIWTSCNTRPGEDQECLGTGQSGHAEGKVKCRRMIQKPQERRHSRRNASDILHGRGKGKMVTRK